MDPHHGRLGGDPYLDRRAVGYARIVFCISDSDLLGEATSTQISSAFVRKVAKIRSVRGALSA